MQVYEILEISENKALQKVATCAEDLVKPNQIFAGWQEQMMMCCYKV